MACLCAPTTHEGSFRCRFHRAPAADQLAAYHHRRHHPGKAALASMPAKTSDPACRLRASTSAAPSTETAQLRCSSSSSAPSSLSMKAPSSPPPRLEVPSSHHCPRPPPSSSRAGSPTATAPLKSLPLGSSTAPLHRRSAALRRIKEAPNVTHATAMAIMKQHLHTKLHLRSGNVARSLPALKIGPSRLSRMSSAHAERDPLLNDAHHGKHTVAIEVPWLPSTSSCARDIPQARQPAAMEETETSLKMHPGIAKFKQRESSCKLMGIEARSHIVSTVY